MFRVAFEQDQAPEPGTAIYYGAQHAAGDVVYAAQTEAGHYEALAVLGLDASQATDLHIGDNQKQILQVLSLPYAITNQDIT